MGGRMGVVTELSVLKRGWHVYQQFSALTGMCIRGLRDLYSCIWTYLDGVMHQRGRDLLCSKN